MRGFGIDIDIDIDHHAEGTALVSPFREERNVSSLNVLDFTIFVKSRPHSLYAWSMILLSFTVRNHKSIRDEVTVEFARPSLKTLTPKDGNWQAAVYPLTGIFGSNASGKSTILDALHFAMSAVRLSATQWQRNPGMIRLPFQLDAESQAASSTYILDLVHQGHRYEYGFEVDGQGIRQEWLRNVPSSRWRTLLKRDRDSGILTFHPSLRTKVEVTARELVLSRALLLENSVLSNFAQAIIDHFDVVLVKDSHRAARLQGIADSLVEGDITFDDLESLLQVADIGVSKVAIEELKVPDNLLRAIQQFNHELHQGEMSDEQTSHTSEKGSEVEDIAEHDLEVVVRSLLFTHRGKQPDTPAFSLDQESDGTIAWLAISVPALQALRRGGVLLIDEIDSSLHPHLLETLLAAFADPLINTLSAQLIFTSHDLYVLTPQSQVQLDPHQVWLVDKTYEGVSELTCLADFPRHPDANVARRYLNGRYGGTPRLSPSRFNVLVDSYRGQD